MSFWAKAEESQTANLVESVRFFTEPALSKTNGFRMTETVFLCFFRQHRLVSKKVLWIQVRTDIFRQVRGPVGHRKVSPLLIRKPII